MLQLQAPVAAAYPACGDKAHLVVGQVQVAHPDAKGAKVQRSRQSTGAAQQGVNLTLPDPQSGGSGVKGQGHRLQRPGQSHFSAKCAVKPRHQNRKVKDIDIPGQRRTVRGDVAGKASRHPTGHKGQVADMAAGFIAAQRQGNGAVPGQQPVQHRHTRHQPGATHSAGHVGETGQQRAGARQIKTRRASQTAPCQCRKPCQIVEGAARRAGQRKALGDVAKCPGGRHLKPWPAQAQIGYGKGAACLPADLRLTGQGRTQSLRQSTIDEGQAHGIKVELTVKSGAIRPAHNATGAAKLHGFGVKRGMVQPFQACLGLPAIAQGAVIAQGQIAGIEPCFAVGGQRQDHRAAVQPQFTGQGKGQRHQIGIKAQAAIQRQRLRRHAELRQGHAAVGVTLALGVQGDVGAEECGVLRQKDRGRIARQIGGEARAILR